MPRPAVVVALPAEETVPVVAELRAAGFEAISIRHPDELEALLAERRDVAIAILDGETDLDVSLEHYSLLHDNGRNVPVLMVVAPSALERMAGGAAAEDEYVTRPYSAESIRWRVEAMVIRSATVDDGSGAGVIAGEVADMDGWSAKGTVVIVFNPKGGVGKTTVATNLAAAVQARNDRSVLLIDADTVTGHILSSLGLDAVPAVADVWRDEAEIGDPAPPFAQLAAGHPNGMRVLALTNSPLTVDLLEPERVENAIEGARRSFDFLVVDLHPSYSALNRALFGIADRILVPVTPDLPALRAALQLRDVAADLGIRDRLAMVVNRANSGVTVEDVERTVGMPALALIRSGGLLFVRAANEGHTVVDRYPREKVAEDFRVLADRLLTPVGGATAEGAATKGGFRFFGRTKEAARA